ncbi:MAG: pyridoxal phosphate-dependent aminotransferase [Pelagibacterales bacterium]|nr:pyridoxal phosphate-dependent aminotransferase [Pelagibacterales bacterium]
MDNSSRLSEKARKFEDEISPVSEILRYADLDYIKSIIKNPNDLISFAGGWVNHNAPEKLRDAYKTISSNIDLFHTSGGYSTTLGEKEFKKAICKFEKKLYNMEINEDEIAVGSGSTQLTMEVLRVLLDPKDKILLLDPTYVNFVPQLTVGFSDIEILRFPIIDENEWKFMADEKIDEFSNFILNEKPKIVLLTSPDNPTSKILSDEFIKKTLEAVKKIGGFLIIDFAYKELVYEDKLPSYFSWPPNDNFISLRSNSKWCRGLGRRLGWIEAPKFVINAMESIQSSTILCPDTLHQMALTKFINDSIDNNILTDYIEDTKKLYKHAAKKTADLIKQNLKFKIIEPDGGLYIFMKVDTDGQEFVQEILKKTGILFIPGWGFGNTGKNAVRISFGPLINNPSKIEEAIIKLSKILKQDN